MRDRVFIKFPDYWKYFLPKEYHKYIPPPPKFPDYWKYFLAEKYHKFIDFPLHLLKALYGYTFSGKFLYKEQAGFLREQGFVPIEIMHALWIKCLPNSKILLLLQYSVDFIYAETFTIAIQDFLNALKSCLK